MGTTSPPGTTLPPGALALGSTASAVLVTHSALLSPHSSLAQRRPSYQAQPGSHCPAAPPPSLDAGESWLRVRAHALGSAALAVLVLHLLSSLYSPFSRSAPAPVCLFSGTMPPIPSFLSPSFDEALCRSDC